MNSISPSTASLITAGLATPSPHLDRGPKAAREFEAHLISSLLESIEKTFSALPREDKMPGADDYNYLGMQSLAEGLAARGGFGIADMIARHLPAHESKG